MSLGNLIVGIAALALVGLLVYRFIIQKKDDGSKQPAKGQNKPGSKPSARPPNRR